MATLRASVVVDGEIGAYHCMARCVRRAALCGEDPLTGRSFDHRKFWLRDRIEQLAQAFAIDIGGYAIMGNHLHVVLKTRPDIARDWEAEEIVRRWRSVFPLRNKPKDVIKAILAQELADKKLINKRRARLANVSWFMRCLLEPIARRANSEDQCTGRFWEERFKCVGLLDDLAVLACTSYVDLNPIRAGIAATPEESVFTSAFDRIKIRQEGRAGGVADSWLAPITTKDRKTRATHRASHTAWLDMSLDEYLDLLDWTGRQIRPDKKGAIAEKLPPILERLKIREEGWLLVARNFVGLFSKWAGSAETVAARALESNLKHVHGKSASKKVFG